MSEGAGRAGCRHMPSHAADSNEPPTSRRAVTWLRLVKLLLSIVLLALGILEAVARLGLN